ncbi:MAG: hypothetical protein U5L45_05665 [Saprospiraceae bacterium]|nr:hypothetical protein [Saprospiraceae bacterium]
MTLTGQHSVNASAQQIWGMMMDGCHGWACDYASGKYAVETIF